MFEVQETLEAQKQDFNRKVNILDSVRYFDVSLISARVTRRRKCSREGRRR